jgi:hypothetical protein
MATWVQIGIVLGVGTTALLLYVEDVSLVEHVHQCLVRTYGHLSTGIVLGWKVAQSIARWAAVRMSRVQIFALVHPSEISQMGGVTVTYIEFHVE